MELSCTQLLCATGISHLLINWGCRCPFHLNLLAAKKVSLADVGIVGGLSDGSDEKEKGPPTSYYMGTAMGAGSGLGRSGFSSSQPMPGNDIFSNLGGEKYQYGGFQK
jgi:epsin